MTSTMQDTSRVEDARNLLWEIPIPDEQWDDPAGVLARLVLSGLGEETPAVLLAELLQPDRFECGCRPSERGCETPGCSNRAYVFVRFRNEEPEPGAPAYEVDWSRCVNSVYIAGICWREFQRALLGPVSAWDAAVKLRADEAAVYSNQDDGLDPATRRGMAFSTAAVPSIEELAAGVGISDAEAAQVIAEVREGGRS